MPGSEDVVTDLYAMTPKQAIEMISAAGADDPAKLIRDHSAAGLVRSFALRHVTINAQGNRTTERGKAIQAHIWERMIRDGVDGDVWGGGTVRLPGSELVGGEAALHITGVAFHPDDIRRLADQQRPPLPPTRKLTSTPPAPQAEAVTQAPVAVEQVKDAPPKRRPNAAAIPPGAILCTVKQAKEALGIGHTKVYELLKAGRLTRAEGVAGTRITVASIKRLAGTSA
jgi:hypothetical protein